MNKYMTMETILIIDDNIETQILLRSILKQYKLLMAYNLREAEAYFLKEKIDLILLDLCLPDGSGMNFLAQLCPEPNVPRTPVIIVSGINDIHSRVEGLNSGADDFITKPFDSEDVLARINSVLRRGPARHSLEFLNIGNLVLDLIEHQAKANIDGELKDLNLTPIEFKILLNFSNHLGQEFSREQLKQIIWKDTFISLRNVDTHICNLRKKLEVTNIDIQNKRTRGYYLNINNFRKTTSSRMFIDSFDLPTNKQLAIN